MRVPNFKAIHKITVETFLLKPQMSTSWWHGSKNGGIATVKRVNPLGAMNVCAKKKTCANLFTVVDVEIFHKRGEALPVALEEKSWGK